jgi:hypothetical protein
MFWDTPQFQALTSNPWTTIVSIISGFIGIGLTLLFGFLTLRKKELKYAMTGSNLIKNSVSRFTSLGIFYDGSKIDTLSVTRLAIWSSGNETIQGSDITSKNPIRVTIIGEGTILAGELISTNKETNNFNVVKELDGSYLIEFEYLDKEDGAVFQFVHTGSSYKNIQLCGTVKGLKELKQGKLVKNVILVNNGGINLNLVLSLGLACFIIWDSFVGHNLIRLPTQVSASATGILAATFVQLIWPLLNSLIYASPKGLEAFNEDV